MFEKMNAHAQGRITKEEAIRFFGDKKFGKLSADAMFDEVDTNRDGDVTEKEWFSFWTQVKGSGYSDQQIVEEVVNMMNGEFWVNWEDQRTVSISPTRRVGSKEDAAIRDFAVPKQSDAEDRHVPILSACPTGRKDSEDKKAR